MTRSPAPLLLAATCLLPLLGCATADTAATHVQAVAQAATSPTLSVQDAAFLDRMARAGIEEVAFGQLARTEGARASTRDYGLRMVNAHTTINQELTRLAGAKHVDVPLTVDLTHHQRYLALQALHGRAFDRAYLDGQATHHAEMLALLRNEAAHGTYRDVRAFAARIEPQIERHLKLAEHLGGHVQPGTP